MFSVLIPVYNFNISVLVNALHRQCEAVGIPYEIFCYDDASESKYDEVNKKISSWNNVRYKRLEKNIGRSRIRNLMARESRFDNLLFLDCDSEVVSENYISNYISCFNAGKVVCGGRVYDAATPSDKKKILHWKAGKKKEEIKAEMRNKKPYTSFMTNNFLISKNIFLENSLDESLQGYGHEDTLFGFQLRRKNIPVVHIDNPLKHIGLENAEEFLVKTGSGISNLIHFWKEKKLQEGELSEISLMKAYFNLRQVFMAGLFLFFFRQFSGSNRKRLLSESPSLFWFDVYKLGLLAQTSVRF